MSLWSKPYRALTIVMKPLLLYFHKRIFVFQNFTNEILIFLKLFTLAIFGCERVKKKKMLLDDRIRSCRVGQGNTENQEDE